MKITEISTITTTKEEKMQGWEGGEEGITENN